MKSLKSLQSIYTNEQTLLVLLARLYFSNCERSEIENFININLINWTIFNNMLQVHGIRSFIYYIIKHYKINLPPTIELSLKKQFSITQYKNLSQINIAQSLIKELRENNICAIPYKGAVFGFFYYIDPGLRESSDIDILINIDDIEKVKAFFEERGYISVSNIPSQYLTYYKQFFRELIFRDPINKINIEVHWRLMDKFAGNYPTHAFFWEHVESFTSKGVSIHKLNPTYDFLIITSNHFVKDMCTKFKYILDVACLMYTHGDNIDSDIIYQTAKKYGFNTKLNTGLAIVDDLLGVTFTQQKPHTLSNNLLKIPLSYPLYLPRMYMSEPQYFTYNLSMQDNFVCKMSYIFRSIVYLFLPTYADIQQTKIHPSLLPLLIINRPLRFIHQTLKAKFKKHSS